jgi:hypothetical protein
MAFDDRRLRSPASRRSDEVPSTAGDIFAVRVAARASRREGGAARHTAAVENAPRVARAAGALGTRTIKRAGYARRHEAWASRR